MSRLSSGLYNIHGKIFFLEYQRKVYAYFIELYNESGEEYCCGGKGLRHPAAGIYVKKVTAIKLKPNEITKEMKTQWKKRIKQSRPYVL